MGLWFSRFFNYYLEDFTDGRGYTGPNQAFQLISFLIYATSFFYAMKHYSYIKKMLFINPYPLLIVILCVASFIWSVDPAVSLRRALAAIGMMFVGLTTVVIVSGISDDRPVYLGFLVGMLVSIFVILVFPNIGIDSGQLVQSHAGLWQGVYGFKNALGQVMSILAIFLVVKVRNIFSGMLFMVTLLMIIKTQSTSSIFSLLFAVSFYFLIKIYKMNYKILFINFLMFFLVFLFMLSYNLDYIVYDVLKKDFSGSGRVDIWSQILNASSDRFLGYGYGGVFWGEYSSAYKYMEEFYINLGHSHNGFVDAKLEFGWIGLYLYILCLLVPIYKHIKNLESSDCILETKLVLLLFILFYSISGSGFMRANTLLFYMYFYASFHDYKLRRWLV